MADPQLDLDVYKIPSNEILKNRREFYGLRRKDVDETTIWLKRVEYYIRRCEFPTIFVQFLLVDRCICGLNNTELATIQNANNWTLNKLLDHFANPNFDFENVGPNISINNDKVNENDDMLSDAKGSEPEAKCSESDPLDLAGQDNLVVKMEPNVIEEEFPPAEGVLPNIEENTIQFPLNVEEEFDHEMFDDVMKFECVRQERSPYNTNQYSQDQRNEFN